MPAMLVTVSLAEPDSFSLRVLCLSLLLEPCCSMPQAANGVTLTLYCSDEAPFLARSSDADASTAACAGAGSRIQIKAVVLPLSAQHSSRGACCELKGVAVLLPLLGRSLPLATHWQHLKHKKMF